MNMNEKMQSCRICGSDELYTREVDATGGGGPDLLPLGAFRWGKFNIVVCGQCGLVEWFVPDDKIERVKEKFERIGKD